MNKEEIIEFAKELYLTPDEEGKHRYSLRDISAKIQQKFSKSINNSTISIWSDKFGWKKLWDSGVRAGIIKGLEGKGGQDEKIEEAISNRRQGSAEDNTKIKEKVVEVLLNSNFTVSEAIKLYEITTRKEQEDLGLISANELLAEKILSKLNGRSDD